MRIYFLGSGRIAVPVMAKLLEQSNWELVGAGTQIDRPAGRRQIPSPTPVGKFLLDSGVEFDRWDKVNSPEFIARLKECGAELLLVVSFGRILGEEVLSCPKFGGLNIHASLLPRYRGASPVIEAIKNCDDTTGVCFMKMAKSLDSGGVYRCFEYPLTNEERAGELEDALGVLASENLSEVIAGIESGNLAPIAQYEALASFCGKVKKSDGLIDFTMPAAKVEAMTRAYDPWPGAYFYLSVNGANAVNATIHRAKIAEASLLNPGEIAVEGRRTILIGCGDGQSLEVCALSLPGKREMTAKDFLNGAHGAGLEVWKSQLKK